jgi:hypothetical protein
MLNMPARSQALTIEDTGTDVLVHDTVRQKIHVLNRTAGLVLMSCDGNTDVAAIAQRLCPERACEVEPDVIRVVDEFARLGLISA